VASPVWKWNQKQGIFDSKSRENAVLESFERLFDSIFDQAANARCDFKMSDSAFLVGNQCGNTRAIS
jgi:hypothetical protein